jgi:hypothetical protein
MTNEATIDAEGVRKAFGAMILHARVLAELGGEGPDPLDDLVLDGRC